MARKTIGALPPVETAGDGAILEIEVDGVSRKVSIEQLREILIPGGLPDLGDIEGRLDDIEEDVDGLEDTYGETESAAGSAAVALSNRTAIAYYRGQVESLVLDATTESGNSAAAAAASALAAAEANAAKSEAISQAGVATIKAGEALASAEDAEGHSVAAASYSSLSAEARDASRAAAVSILPSGFNDSYQWLTERGMPTFPGGVMRTAGVGFPGGVYSRGSLPLIAGHTYRLSIRHQAIVDKPDVSPLYAYAGWHARDADGDIIGPIEVSTAEQWAGAFAIPMTVASGIVSNDGTFTAEDVWAVAGFEAAVAVSSVGLVGWTGAGASQAEILALKLEDITAAQQAVVAAAASVTNAAAAAASATESGNSATASQTSRLAAEAAEDGAIAQAGVATVQAAAASDHAAAAFSSSVLTAGFAPGGLVKNSRFQLWTDPVTGVLPDWVPLTVGGGQQRAAGVNYPFALQMLANTGHDVWQHQDIPGLAPNTYYMMVAYVRLNAGQFNSSGVHFHFSNALGDEFNGQIFNLDFHALYGVGTAGRTYSASVLIHSTNPDTVAGRIHPMAHWSGFGDRSTYIDVSFLWVDIRPASAEEIRAGTAIPTLQATVSTQAGVIADHEDKLAAAYWETVATAGDAVAAVRLLASSDDGSSIELQAKEVSIWNDVAGDVRRVIRAANGSVEVAGDFRFGGKVTRGDGSATDWNMGLQDQVFEVADGATLSWSNIGTIPTALFSTVGLAAHAAGETYRLYLDSPSLTGATFRARIQTPGTPTGYSVGPSTAAGGGGAPQMVVSKGGNPDATSGNYVITASVLAYSNAYTDLDQPGPNNKYASFSGTVAVYAKVGGSWIVVATRSFSGTRGPYSTTGLKGEAFDLGAGLTISVPSGATDFGWSVTSAYGTGNGQAVPQQIAQVAWTVTSGTGDRSASPSGETCQVRVSV